MDSVLNCIRESKKVVVKVGTSSLTYSTGKINFRTIEKLVRVLSDLRNQGKDVILVTSGAIGVGMGKLGLEKRPETTRGKQAVAAVGQCELMQIYDKFFSEYGQIIAQVLLTRDVVEDEVRKNNSINTFNTLLGLGIIPIVNENDTVSTYEIEFGDNDRLSATVSELIGADLLVILTDTDGLYDIDPRVNHNANLINIVEEVNDGIKDIAGGVGTSRGTGGMATKILAAEMACNAGTNVIIMNGKEPKLLYKIFDGKQVGTLFLKKGQKIKKCSD
jgi:glutamate 5-kinase